MIYVVIQFSAIFLLIVNANINNINTYSLILFIASTIIGVIAIINMKISNLNIVPELKDNHKLATNGIYKYIRHPMYTSVILLCLGFLLTEITTVNIIAMLVLIIDLFLKSRLEEKLLEQRFNSYKDYKNSTYRFLPFI
tara:strand:- start:314 stop:730 length:417 start_codon:yes stop_codon:yes gene_type:complete